MIISAAEAAIICIASAAALGFGAVLAGFVLMRFGCCNGSVAGLADDNRRGRRRRDRDAAGLQGSASSGDAVAEREWKGIPLNSRPPRLTPEQEILRDKAMEKYRRRQARQERRQQRQAARDARLANAREGGGREDPVSEVDDFDDGSSMTSRSTLKSAATTVRTTSTAAYGHGAYLLAPPGTYAMPEDDDGNGVPEDCRSARSGGSRRSSGTTRSRASQGTVASIKSHLRHRQRQRLRRREEQQHVELFNQWAHAQMASSSELSPSSHASSAAESVHGEDDQPGNGGAAGRRHTGGRHGNGSGLARRFRSASVASSAPRPPEEVLGGHHAAYPFLAGGAPTTYTDAAAAPDTHERSVRVDAGEPYTASTYMSGGALHAAAVPATSEANGGRTGSAEAPEPTQPRRHRRTWKDVEHNVALSGFFNSPTNNGSMAGVDFLTPRNGGYVDDEAPAPFPRSPAQQPRNSTESHEPITRE